MMKVIENKVHIMYENMAKMSYAGIDVFLCYAVYY